MYKFLPYDTYNNREQKIIMRTSDNCYIPMDERNSDYIEYLKWVAEGNTPLAADGGTQ